jgi:hypothetical protein
MRYMTIVSGPESFGAAGPPPAALYEAVGKLIEEAAKSGKLESFGGLKPTAEGTRFRITKGRMLTTDGPFSESKEVIGGFSIYNFASKEEALEEVRRFTELHVRLWPGWEGTIELRPMYGEEDDVAATQAEASRQLQG